MAKKLALIDPDLLVRLLATTPKERSPANPTVGEMTRLDDKMNALNTKGVSTGHLPGAILIASSSLGGGRHSVCVSRCTNGVDGDDISETSSSVSGSMTMAIRSEGGGSSDRST